MSNTGYKNLQIEISEELKKQLKIEAAKRGVTLTTMVRLLLEKFIVETNNKE